MGQIVGLRVALVLVLLAIFFSQSRGPLDRLLAGLGVFVNLCCCVCLIRLSRERGALGTTPPPPARPDGDASALGVALAGLLLVFNVSEAPVFERLRAVPYVGRLGQLLETDDGTGRVRTLIWAGDDRGGGTIGLITSNLAPHPDIGYGPETMFTAYNPFYPPELARYEARGASPDRSHQAMLDELVTKGALGLLSYFFLFFSAVWLALRSRCGARQPALSGAGDRLLAAVLAHFVEVLIGIPIVSTLTMLWTSLGILVAAGFVEGLWTVDGRARERSRAR